MEAELYSSLRNWLARSFFPPPPVSKQDTAYWHHDIPSHPHACQIVFFVCHTLHKLYQCSVGVVRRRKGNYLSNHPQGQVFQVSTHASHNQAAVIQAERNQLPFLVFFSPRKWDGFQDSMEKNVASFNLKSYLSHHLWCMGSITMSLPWSLLHEPTSKQKATLVRPEQNTLWAGLGSSTGYTHTFYISSIKLVYK